MSRGTRRGRSRGEGANVSLFPFLAVLICTMGALIVLLVVTVQQAGNATAGAQTQTVATVEPINLVEEEADPLHLEQAASELAELQRTKEDLAWHADGLAVARESLLAALKQQQLQLSTVEDQTYQLQERITRLKDEVATLKSAARDQEESHDSTARLAQLQSEIDQAKVELEAARQAADERNQRFAIIPRAGANGTNRRPLYVECLPDRVILQPEGIELATSDFQTPIGPENPLASALRAKREFLLNAGVVSSSGEPYPLILVRPGAERAYAACRDALTGWDEEFGYELVPSDMKLAYPPVDKLLVGFMEKIIDQVRARRTLIAGDTPDSSGVVLGVSHEKGGFVPAGTSSISTAGGLAESGPKDVATAEADGPFAGNSRMRGSNAKSQRRDASNPFPSSASATDATVSGRNEEHEPVPTTERVSESTRGGSFPAASTKGVTKQDSAYVQVGNYELKSSASGGHEGAGSSSSQVEFASGVGGGGGAAPTPTHVGENADSQSSGGAQMSFSMAKTQGKNWALPNDTEGAIGVVRPVYLTCTEHGMILHPDSRANQQQVEIPFAVTTSSAIQPFVGFLWDRMEAWGVAGNGMYWQPLLKCEIGPGGEERFHELSELLHGSGLEVTRR